MSSRILVFIPCYNCEAQISRVLSQFDDQMQSWFCEILVLDNGSRDNTIAAAAQAARLLTGIKVTIGKNRSNYNLGGSHKVAFDYAAKNGCTHVVVLHGDDQGSIHDLLPVLTSKDHESFDACLGARFMPESKLAGYSLFRIVGNHVFNALFSIGTARAVKDLGSGLNIFGARVINDPRVRLYADDLRFNIYLLLGLFHGGLKTTYFPISWREDDQVSNVKMTSQALKTLKLLGESIFDSSNFRERDHREVKHASYQFDVIASDSAAPGPSSSPPGVAGSIQAQP
jgi:dolichol-phosphate mannosyltransferase